MDTAESLKNPIETARLKAGLPLTSLSNLTGIPRTSLRRKIQHPSTLTLGELDALSAVLAIDAAETFAAINGRVA